jgi:hypothetical protein
MKINAKKSSVTPKRKPKATSSKPTTAMEHALAYAAAGLSPLPILPGGGKKPRGTWKICQSEILSTRSIKRRFKDGDGVAIAYGPASGNAELIDIDDGEVKEPYFARVEEVCPGLGLAGK